MAHRERFEYRVARNGHDQDDGRIDSANPNAEDVLLGWLDQKRVHPGRWPEFTIRQVRPRRGPEVRAA